jgi:hypothetical protein
MPIGKDIEDFNVEHVVSDGQAMYLSGKGPWVIAANAISHPSRPSPGASLFHDPAERR